MTARKDKRGKYHNTLDQPLLPKDQADELKAKLFGVTKPEVVRAMHKIAGDDVDGDWADPTHE